jgi:hypothetical protein
MTSPNCECLACRLWQVVMTQAPLPDPRTGHFPATFPEVVDALGAVLADLLCELDDNDAKAAVLDIYAVSRAARIRVVLRSIQPEGHA